MRKISSFSIQRIIFWTCFIPSFFYIILYEFVLIKYPSCTDIFYKVGRISLTIAYSIMATSIFYFISQYLGVIIPKKRRKIKILPIVHQNTLKIDDILKRLTLKLGINQEKYRETDYFSKVLKTIKTDQKIEGFNNWYLYLESIINDLLIRIRSITPYHEYLDQEFFQELIIIEQRLMSLNTFAGYQIVSFSYSETDLQEIFIHNQILQNLRATELKKYKQQILKASKFYRLNNFNDKDNN